MTYPAKIDQANLQKVLNSMVGKTVAKVDADTGCYPDLIDCVKIGFTDGTSIHINADGHADDTCLDADFEVEFPDPCYD